MIEYEYSEVVDRIEPYLVYCQKNGFEKVADSYQIRELYTSSNQILARFTTEIVNEKEVTYLDFKDENNSNDLLKVARESIPLMVTKENQESIQSMISMLGYTRAKVLKRKRIIYQKNDVKFEIDEYLEPIKQYVVAIEGEKRAVDHTYEEISNNVREASSK